MTSFAVAGSDRNTARQTDHILPSGRSVPAVFIVGGGFAEHDAGRRQAFRQLARGRLLDPVDLDIAEMRLAVGILVQIVDTHRSTLLYLPAIPGFGPREFDFPHRARAGQQNWPTSGIRQYLATGGRAALQGYRRGLTRLSALFGFSRCSLRV